jgi:hypothetical protein
VSPDELDSGRSSPDFIKPHLRKPAVTTSPRRNYDRETFGVSKFKSIDYTNQQLTKLNNVFSPESINKGPLRKKEVIFEIIKEDKGEESKMISPDFVKPPQPI